MGWWSERVVPCREDVQHEGNTSLPGEQAGFRIAHIANSQLKAPKFGGYMYEGAAVIPD